MRIAGFTIYPYGLALAAAAWFCLRFAGVQVRKYHLDKETPYIFAVWSLPLCLLFSRLLYCLICMDGFSRDGITFFFHFTGGGFTLWGAVVGGALALLITTMRTRQPIGRIADALTVPVVLFLALCRISEGLAGQGYGWYIEDWFDPESGMSLFHPDDYEVFFHFPFAIQDMYGEWCWAVFVLEALFAIGICVFAWSRCHKHEGMVALEALLLVASTQILCESLRQDAVLRFGFIRINQVISAIVVTSILAYGCYRFCRGQIKMVFGCLVRLGICIGIVISMEFALEKKITFLEWMSMDVCYLVMAVACAGMYRCVMAAFKGKREGNSCRA